MTPLDGPPARPGDRGSATVLVLALVAVLSAVSALLVAAGALVVARHRSDAAADLSALAAAARAPDGQGAACAAAARVARGNGAEVVACRLLGDVALVTAEVLPPGRLSGLGPARTTARAGPARLVPSATGTP